MTREKWKGFARGYYEVSNLGRVRRAKPGPSTRPGRILRPSVSEKGYLQVTYHHEGRQYTRKVHKLVADAFLGSCPSQMEANHIDADKSRNHATNLEYITHTDNVHHAMRRGLALCVIPQATVDRIRKLRSDGVTYKDISKDTGVSKTYCRLLALNKYRVQRL